MSKQRKHYPIFSHFEVAQVVGSKPGISTPRLEKHFGHPRELRMILTSLRQEGIIERSGRGWQVKLSAKDQAKLKKAARQSALKTPDARIAELEQQVLVLKAELGGAYDRIMELGQQARQLQEALIYRDDYLQGLLAKHPEIEQAVTFTLLQKR